MVTMAVIIATSGRIATATQSIMKEVLAEAANANAAAGEKVVSVINSITLDSLSFPPNPSV